MKEGLQKNTSMDTFISMLDSKAKITIWKSETEKVFDGKVYQLYDNVELKAMYITYLRFDSMAGINVVITEEWQN